MGLTNTQVESKNGDDDGGLDKRVRPLTVYPSDR